MYIQITYSRDPSEAVVIYYNTSGPDDPSVVIVIYRYTFDLDHCSKIVVLNIRTIIIPGVVTHVQTRVYSGCLDHSWVVQEVELPVLIYGKFHVSFNKDKGFAITIGAACSS